MNRITLPLSLLLVLPLVLPVQAQKQNGRPRNRSLGIAALVTHPAVYKELKLQDEQTAALKQAVEESRKSARAAQQLPLPCAQSAGDDGLAGPIDQCAG